MEIIVIGVIKEIGCFYWGLVFLGELLEFECEWSLGGCDGLGGEGGISVVWEVVWRVLLRRGFFRKVYLEIRWGGRSVFF